MVCINRTVPSDAIRNVFTPSVMSLFRRAKNPTETLRWRLNVLDACGPMPEDGWLAAWVPGWRAQKAAWEAYLTAAFVCGLFEGKACDNLRTRLTDVRDDQFRGAMAECLACWFLRCLGHTVSCGPNGKGNSLLDLQVLATGVNFAVEVKAPHREFLTPTTPGDVSADKISSSLHRASKQFAKDRANVLVLAPSLIVSMTKERDSLLRALYWDSEWRWTVDGSKEKSAHASNGRVVSRPTGKFLQTGGGKLKPDGLPAHRRISAVLCLEEVFCEKLPHPIRMIPCGPTDAGARKNAIRDFALHREAYCGPRNAFWISHRAVVLHNPYAYRPIAESVFAELPQFVPRGNEMEWTDGYRCAE